MKPKKKSNAIYMVLLFLFSSFVSSGANFSAAADTIIIDGEAIYIVKKELSTNVDSLQQIASADVRIKPLPAHLWTAGFYSGINATRATFRSSVSDMQTLDEFTESNSSTQANLCLKGDLGFRLWRFPAGKGMVDLTFCAAASWNQIKVASQQLTDESQFVQDSLIRLRYVQGELLLDYFERYEPTPFGELDTVSIDFSRHLTEYNTIDIPFVLRFSYAREKSKIKFYGEAGVVKRMLLGNGTNQDNFLVNENGLFTKLEREEFKAQNLILPIATLGVERRIESGAESDGTYFAWGAQFSSALQRAAFNKGSLFVMDVSNASLSLFVRGYF